MSVEQLMSNNESFLHHYQPIFDLKEGTIKGYEGLLRHKKLESTEFLFKRAKSRKRLYKLDSRSIYKAILTYQTAGFTKKEGSLFLNVFPSTLLNHKFPSF
ncbi:EAL domain-containing protein, partial [Virgibacillus sp. W0430]